MAETNARTEALVRRLMPQIEQEYTSDGKTRFWAVSYALDGWGSEQEITEALLTLCSRGCLTAEADLFCPDGHKVATVPFTQPEPLPIVLCLECETDGIEAHAETLRLRFLLAPAWRSEIDDRRTPKATGAVRRSGQDACPLGMA